VLAQFMWKQVTAVTNKATSDPPTTSCTFSCKTTSHRYKISKLGFTLLYYVCFNL